MYVINGSKNAKKNVIKVENICAKLIIFLLLDISFDILFLIKTCINLAKSSNHTYSEIRDLTVKIERLGFESVHVTDHFFSLGDQKRFRESISIINEKLKRYGRDPTEFEISFYTYITIVDSQETLERIRKEKRIFRSNMKYQFMGNVNTIQEKIYEVENLGVKKMVIIVESPDMEDPISFFSKEIM